MAKFQDPIDVGAHDIVDIRDLIRRRTNAKPEVNLELEYVVPLLKVSSEDTNDVAVRVNDSTKKVGKLSLALGEGDFVLRKWRI